MIIREITVGELPAFTTSALYRGSSVIPITPERVASHVNNPRAQPGDVVLVVAYTDEGELAGFAGMLPDTGYSAEGSYRFAWNSGWWTDAEKGKGIALNLFYRSVQAWKGQFMITDLTPHTRKIIGLTRLFSFSKPLQGIRYQICADFAGKFRRRYRSWHIFSPLPALADHTLNLVLRARLSRWLRKSGGGELHTEISHDPDEESLAFIQSQNRHELCRRGREEFRWITAFPWLTENPEGMQGMNYPFSWVGRHMEYTWMKAMFRGSLAGVALLSNRDGLYRMPYAWFDRGNSDLFCLALCRTLAAGRATEFYTAREEVNTFMKRHTFPAFYRKTIVQELAVCHSIGDRHPGDFLLQDGDGDAVFT